MISSGSTRGFRVVKGEHLIKEIVNPILGPVNREIRAELTILINHCFAGRIPSFISLIFLGAFRCEAKIDGCIRPITVGSKPSPFNGQGEGQKRQR